MLPTATPTPTPTATATNILARARPAQRSPSYVPSGRYAELICAEEFSWSCEWALAIVWCESTNDPNAYNPDGPFMGLWQVTNGSYDPYLNTVEAHIKYVSWQRSEVDNPWPYCP